MAIRVSYKSFLAALLLILFICSPTQARSLREIVRNRTLLVVEKGQASRKIRHEGGGSDVDGLDRPVGLGQGSILPRRSFALSLLWPPGNLPADLLRRPRPPVYQGALKWRLKNPCDAGLGPVG
ncbi:hypothetical protein ISN45_Aa08g029190 [Arabidopsis thaliana x Arabidopsis arenosa]|uniref:Transmembrane protein n=1 Tax=Arabidopsis thaliana x Arabidopsis arenosa TaxID=1240361 RepID=A0A8T1XSH4_9BRAS|nr:hypothetical protein ISN45_Aa08g029190 [Arabidopsis thaliana x Arabidopsis arenosa]